jgi:hypothetical protein
MPSRYDNREILRNNNEMYKSVFKNRNVAFIRQYSTPLFRYPNSEQSTTYQVDSVIWGVGDKFYKLADQYYGDSSLWWIIAKFNNKPTESHLDVGDVVLIPYPVSSILNVMIG